MRKLIVVSLFLLFISCETENHVGNPRFRVFAPLDIESLELENINGFWDGDSAKSISDESRGLFIHYDGFLGGKSFRGEAKGIRVTVFKTQSDAIKAMENRIADVSCLILSGRSGKISNQWWYSDCIPKMVFLNEKNTIIEVYIYKEEFQEIENVLIDTAIEIQNRVEKLSR